MQPLRRRGHVAEPQVEPFPVAPFDVPRAVGMVPTAEDPRAQRAERRGTRRLSLEAIDALPAVAAAAELRLGCKNAWKIWLNGELVFGHDEYHRGMRIDQYKLPVQLKKGGNTIVVKACQNEQVEDWTVQWQFQLRVGDATGTAIHSATKKNREVATQ